MNKFSIAALITTLGLLSFPAAVMAESVFTGGTSSVSRNATGIVQQVSTDELLNKLGYFGNADVQALSAAQSINVFRVNAGEEDAYSRITEHSTEFFRVQSSISANPAALGALSTRGINVRDVATIASDANGNVTVYLY